MVSCKYKFILWFFIYNEKSYVSFVVNIKRKINEGKRINGLQGWKLWQVRSTAVKILLLLRMLSLP